MTDQIVASKCSTESDLQIIYDEIVKCNENIQHLTEIVNKLKERVDKIPIPDRKSDEWPDEDPYYA